MPVPVIRYIQSRLSVLVQVMLTPIAGMVQAHGLLVPEERKVWALGLTAVKISLGDAVKRMCHQEGGRLAHSELLAGGWNGVLRMRKSRSGRMCHQEGGRLTH